MFWMCIVVGLFFVSNLLGIACLGMGRLLRASDALWVSFVVLVQNVLAAVAAWALL